jgi:hypothetical protein
MTDPRTVHSSLVIRDLDFFVIGHWWVIRHYAAVIAQRSFA